jgi:threonine dehydratase
MKLPVFEDVKRATRRIHGFAVPTPLLSPPVINELTGATVYLKPENLQRTGSFKFRGAYNALSLLDDEARAAGIVAVSSGNHGQGIAEAARLLGIHATVIMPSDAPAMKIERVRRLGAAVELYDRVTGDREALARELVETTGATFIHPFNHPDVIAGQGTVGLEIARDLQAMEETPDHVFVCTGGGGLTAGVALSVLEVFAQVRVHTCEPEGFDDYRRSLESGRIEQNLRRDGSVCDAIITPSPGEISFEINRNRLAEGMVVTDREAMDAVAFAFRELKLVLEPGGAVGLAALLKSGKQFSGETIVVVLSGGNIDPELMLKALGGQK